jgi:uncharacterized Fe-S center protein
MTKVYFAPLADCPSLEEQTNAVARIAAAAGMDGIIAENDYVAIKLHVGEPNNTTYIKPELVKRLVELCRPRTGNVFLTETSTLYKGERENAVKHLLHAHARGFGIDAVGAPWIMADGLTGNTEIEVEVGGEYEQTVKIAREIAFADVLIAVSHPTGHIATGMGACLKNLGMGLASRTGKLRQHSSILPKVDPVECVFCRKCLFWCPVNAIDSVDGKAFIDESKCIGCGECLAVCRYHAIQYNWGTESEPLQKRMVEHACGVVKHKPGKCFYLNVLVDMTRDCDCFDIDQPKMVPDIGIVGSFDPVAVDKATLDLTARANGVSLSRQAYPELDPLIQMEYAAKLGLGSLEYELARI